MRITYTLLSQPGGKFHWVLRIWHNGPEATPTIYSAKQSYISPMEALKDAIEECATRTAKPLNVPTVP